MAIVTVPLQRVVKESIDTSVVFNKKSRQLISDIFVQAAIDSTSEEKIAAYQTTNVSRRASNTGIRVNVVPVEYLWEALDKVLPTSFADSAEADQLQAIRDFYMDIDTSAEGNVTWNTVEAELLSHTRRDNARSKLPILDAIINDYGELPKERKAALNQVSGVMIDLGLLLPNLFGPDTENLGIADAMPASTLDAMFHGQSMDVRHEEREFDISRRLFVPKNRDRAQMLSQTGPEYVKKLDYDRRATNRLAWYKDKVKQKLGPSIGYLIEMGFLIFPQDLTPEELLAHQQDKQLAKKLLTPERIDRLSTLKTAVFTNVWDVYTQTFVENKVFNDRSPYYGALITSKVLPGPVEMRRLRITDK